MIYYSANNTIDIIDCHGLTREEIVSHMENGYFLNVVDEKKTTVIHANAEVKAFSVKVYERKSRTSEPEMIRAHTGSILNLKSELSDLGMRLKESGFLIKVNEL